MWFINQLRHAVPELETEEFTLISDLDMGLIKVDSTFLKVVHA